MIGQNYVEQFIRLNYGEIVAWVDKQYALYTNLNVKGVEYINNIDVYDYVIIAVGVQAVAEKIRQILITMGVDKTKIIWSI